MFSSEMVVCTPMSGWPKPSGVTGGFRAPTIYDLDGDDVPEIMIGSPTDVRVWHADGSIMSGFPQPVGGNITATLAVGDITGDGLCEVLVAGYQISVVTRVHAYNGDGSVALDFPISAPGYCGPNSPEVGDIDRDGDLEMAFTMGSGHVAVWDFPIDYSEPTTGWGALFHDDWNTNQYGFIVPHEITFIENNEMSLTHQPLKACPNPFNPMTSINIPLAAAGSASLRIYTLTGRCVATLVDGELASGSHSFGWNASGLASGVYLVQLNTSVGLSSLCLVLLR